MSVLVDNFVVAALSRAIVIGAFGAIGLALTVTYSRRGPLIFPVYAAILGTIAVLLARFPTLSFASRYGAAMIGFTVATAGLYLTTVVVAQRTRNRLARQGRIEPALADVRVSIAGHAWRVGGVLGLGAALCAGVAFIST